MLKSAPCEVHVEITHHGLFQAPNSKAAGQRTQNNGDWYSLLLFCCCSNQAIHKKVLLVSAMMVLPAWIWHWYACCVVLVL
jgi:hypothetical protein